MDVNEGLARRFEAKRTHLRAVAFRMLGSRSEADDAVQEAWLRLSRAEASEVDNLGGWLTTVVARVCLDMLRARKAHREDPLETDLEGENEVASMELADAVGPALVVLLETLSPGERLAFVLHDMFGVSFEEIAPIVGKSPTAARQLASRARRAVRGAARDGDGDADRTRRQELVAAFVAASRNGDFAQLLAVLDPGVVLRADPTAVALGAALGMKPEIHGSDAVAKTFCGRAKAAQRAFVEGEAGVVWAPGGKPKVVFDFTIANGKIVAIDLVAEPARVAELDLVVVG